MILPSRLAEWRFRVRAIHLAPRVQQPGMIGAQGSRQPRRIGGETAQLVCEQDLEALEGPSDCGIEGERRFGARIFVGLPKETRKPTHGVTCLPSARVAGEETPADGRNP